MKITLVCFIILLLGGCQSLESNSNVLKRRWARNIVSPQTLSKEGPFAHETLSLLKFEDHVLVQSRKKGLILLEPWGGFLKQIVLVPGGVSSESFLDGEQIYLGSQDSSLISYNLKTKNQVWETQLDADVASGIQKHGEHLYFLNSAGRLNKVSSKDGSLVWSQDVRRGQALESMEILGAPKPLIHNSKIYVVNSLGQLSAHDLVSGSMQWYKFYDYNSGIQDLDVLFFAKDKQSLFISQFGLNLIKVSAHTGEKIWTRNLPVSKATLGENSLWVSGTDQKIYKLNSSSGETLWSQKTSGIATELVSLPGDQMAFGLSDGGVEVVSSQDGTSLSKYETLASVSSKPIWETRTGSLIFLSAHSVVYSVVFKNTSKPLFGLLN